MSELRVVPGTTSIGNVSKHIARYNISLMYAQDKRVLDVACGSGYGSKMLSWVAKDVVGWDVDQEAIDCARKNYGAKNIAYYKQDLNNIDFDKLNQNGATNKFDVIISFETLEHLKNPKKTIDDYKKLLNPGGIIVGSVPLNEAPGQNEHHEHTYTIRQARQLFSDLNKGLELVQHGLSFYPPEEPIISQKFSYYIFAGN